MLNGNGHTICSHASCGAVLSSSLRSRSKSSLQCIQEAYLSIIHLSDKEQQNAGQRPLFEPQQGDLHRREPFRKRKSGSTWLRGGHGPLLQADQEWGKRVM